MTSTPAVKVWDPLVRVGHWLLVAGVAAAWITRSGSGANHEWIGYGTLAVVAARTVWGFVGTEHARFATFVRPPATTWRYAVDVLRHREPRFIGHNPLGGYMIVLLLIIVAMTGASGWLYTTDRYWGIEWVENLHSTLANLLLMLAALHVLGVVAASIRHRENLVASMVHGRKREANGSPD